MVPFAAGVVVLVYFPFSELSQTKLRPAVVFADAGRGDWILCQVTSKPYADSAAVTLKPGIFNEVLYRSPATHGQANASQQL